MDKIKPYIKEIKLTRDYILGIFLFIFASFSIYFYLDTETIMRVGDEDNFFESATAVFLLWSSVLLFLIFLESKNKFFLILAIVMFFGFGEEISWGQRIFNFSTPEGLKEINVQKEVSLHNITLFQRTDNIGNKKEGLSRLTEINFLFKVFTIVFGIILPFLVYHFKSISKISHFLKIPVPPISIGIFFLVNWLAYSVMYNFVLPGGMHIQYYDTIYEIMEYNSTFVLFMVSLYFYLNRYSHPPGKDIKLLVFKKRLTIESPVTSISSFLSVRDLRVAVLRRFQK